VLYTHDHPRPSKVDDLLDPRLAARLDAVDLRTTKIFSGKLQGERRSKKRGQSVEFDDYRDYTPGDDLRHIDWNVYARFDRLFIKLFLEEEDLSLHIALDASPSMHAGKPAKALFAARLAAALAYVGLVNNNRVGITVFGAPPQSAASDEAASPTATLRRLPELRGRRHVPRIAQFLIDSIWGAPGSSPVASGGPSASFSDSLAAIARMRVGKGVMVVLSDFLIAPEEGGYEPGLRSLAAAGGYDTWCVQVLSPAELEPEREVQQGVAGDLRLTDVETGRAAEVTMTAGLIKQYKQRLERYCAELHAFAASREMTHLIARSDAPIDALMLDTLRRQGMLG
jgi:hypothetical protein